MSWDIAAQTGAGVAQDINRTACSDLDALLALAGSLVPGLDGRIGPVSGDIRPGADNRATLRTLQDWWRLRHPEAGSHYLALRCWGLLIWQPIYLGVIAVHCSDIAPDLDRLGQPVRDGFIAGYILERHEPLRGCLEQRKGGSCRSATPDLRDLFSGALPTVAPEPARRGVHAGGLRAYPLC